MNINTELFKRYAPAKKIEIINNLSDAELLAVTPDTILRVTKEAGTNRYKSRDKRLYLGKFREGNDWNSDIEAVETYKGKLFVDVYMQFDNTDTNVSMSFSDFMRYGRAEVKSSDRYGNPRTYYATYDDYDKARVIRGILLQYVHTKYADKL